MQAEDAQRVQLYLGRAYALAFSLVLDSGDAAELTRQALSQALADRQVPPERWPTLLKQLVVQHCREHLEKRRRLVTALDHLHDRGRISLPLAESLTRRMDLDRIIPSALVDLPPQVRSVTLLRHCGDHDYQAIAAFLQLPAAQVQRQLIRAGDHLREILGPHLSGAPPTAPACAERRADLQGLVDGELEEDRSRDLRTHLDGCARCAQVLETSRLLRDLQLEAFQSPDPAEFMARLEEAAAGSRASTRARAPAPDGRELAGRVLGGHRLLRHIASGGMGSVYEAQQLSLERRVALKVLAGELVRDPEYVQRFRREALAAAALEHPHLVRVFQVGEEDGWHYFTMEYVEGETLRARLRRDGPLSVKQGLTIARAMAQALAHAAQRGVVHRDIKPENIIAGPGGQLKLTDMGLAKRMDGNDAGAARLTQQGTVMGTPHYIAPEQARSSAQADTRSDIYSLGATTYHLLTGRTPFEGQNAIDILAHVLNDPLSFPPPPAPQLPLTVQNLLLKMLAKDPAQRPQTPKALIAEIDACAAETEEADPATTASRRSARPVATEPRRAWLPLVAGAAAVSLAIWLVTSWPRTKPAPAPLVTTRLPEPPRVQTPSKDPPAQPTPPPKRPPEPAQPVEPVVASVEGPKPEPPPDRPAPTGPEPRPAPTESHAHVDPVLSLARILIERLDEMLAGGHYPEAYAETLRFLAEHPQGPGADLIRECQGRVVQRWREHLETRIAEAEKLLADDRPSEALDALPRLSQEAPRDLRTRIQTAREELEAAALKRLQAAIESAGPLLSHGKREPVLFAGVIWLTREPHPPGWSPALVAALDELRRQVYAATFHVSAAGWEKGDVWLRYDFKDEQSNEDFSAQGLGGGNPMGREFWLDRRVDENSDRCGLSLEGRGLALHAGRFTDHLMFECRLKLEVGKQVVLALWAGEVAPPRYLGLLGVDPERPVGGAQPLGPKGKPRRVEPDRIDGLFLCRGRPIPQNLDPLGTPRPTALAAKTTIKLHFKDDGKALVLARNDKKIQARSDRQGPSEGGVGLGMFDNEALVLDLEIRGQPQPEHLRQRVAKFVQQR